MHNPRILYGFSPVIKETWEKRSEKEARSLLLPGAPGLIQALEGTDHSLN